MCHNSEFQRIDSSGGGCMQRRAVCFLVVRKQKAVDSEGQGGLEDLSPGSDSSVKAPLLTPSMPQYRLDSSTDSFIPLMTYLSPEASLWTLTLSNQVEKHA